MDRYSRLTTVKGKLLLFEVQSELYALEIGDVLEVSNFLRLKKQGVPSCITGMATLRKMTIPVLDLGKRFGFGNIRGKGKKIVVLDNDLRLGLIVNSLSGVIDYDNSSLEKLPEINSTSESCVKGIFKRDDLLIAVIEPDLLLKDDEKIELAMYLS